MSKTKKLLIALILLIAVLLLPNMVNADETTVTVERNIYSMDGSMKFTFSGLTIDTTHEYKYGFTKTPVATVEDWYLLTEYTENSATANIMTGTKEMREVINTDDTGYITIKDTTTDTVVLQPYAVDLKLPYLRVTNYEVVSNGQDLTDDYEINVPLRNASNSEAYYKYEKITDQNLINKYKEIKANSEDYIDLESMLKTTPPTSGYSTWGYWNGHGSDGRNGFGYTTRTVNAPDTGLYYLWVYFSGESIKNLYGCIIVDNLQPEIAVDSISLPATKTVELGKTITLSPTFNPTTATNKIVTWESSDETVATVDNAGKVTPIKVGSTIIKVTTQDGNKTATCTVTVTAAETEEETKKYISFPFMLYFGTTTIDLKQGVYDGEYTMYYQFVEVTNENEETKYDDTKWIETKDRKLAAPSFEYTGEKKFDLWIKLVMEDEAVYESYRYKFNGSGTPTNEPEEQDKPTVTDKDTTKDDTTAKDDLPNTGRVLLFWIIGIVAASGIVAHIRYKKLYM